MHIELRRDRGARVAIQEQPLEATDLTVWATEPGRAVGARRPRLILLVEQRDGALRYRLTGTVNGLRAAVVIAEGLVPVVDPGVDPCGLDGPGPIDDDPFRVRENGLDE